MQNEYNQLFEDYVKLLDRWDNLKYAIHTTTRSLSQESGAFSEGKVSAMEDVLEVMASMKGARE